MSIKTDISNLLIEVRNKVPLIHNITNYVTVNDCANITLAIGASPIMADDIEEVEDITSISSALVINIGTLNKRTIEAAIKAGKKANELKIPVIFDPVGAGASRLRNETTKKILDEIKITILRGNLSEISFIAGISANTKGVDSSKEDEKNDKILIAKNVAKKLNCIVAITGATDIISDGKKVVKILNGNSMLSKVTGTGCMTTSLVASYSGITNDYFLAAISGIASMGICGEIAYKNIGNAGTGSFHIAIIDAISNLDKKTFEEMIKLEQE